MFFSFGAIKNNSKLTNFMNSKTLSTQLIEEIKNNIISVLDFPVPGINFRDITPLFLRPHLFQGIVDYFSQQAQALGADVLLVPESRGFIFGAAISYAAGIPFVLARKQGKLPRKTMQQSYTLEYGTNVFEIHADAIVPGQRVVIVDDVLATGGTAQCLESMVTKFGAVAVGALYLIELPGLNARKKFQTTIVSLIQY